MITRIIFKILILFSCVSLYAQTDTIYLAGNSRLSGDTVYLRWNARNPVSFGHLIKSTIVVEKQNMEDLSWTKIQELSPVSLEKWTLNKTQTNRQILLAAASLDNWEKLDKKSAVTPEEFQQIQQDLNFLWMNIALSADIDAEVAQLCNLSFSYPNKAKTYPAYYRIFCYGTDGISDTLNYVLTGVQYLPEKVGNPSAIEKENEVEIRWQASKSFSAYFIEKSEKGKSFFVKLNAAPLVIPANQGEAPILYFSDSVANYQPAEYRIYGIDMFGQKSLYSATVIAQGKDKTPPPPLTGLKVIENPDKTITLSWDKPDILNGEKGIAIGYKHINEGFYSPAEKKLLPLDQNTYSFKTFPDQTDYFFALQIFDTAGNSSITEAFYQMNDNTAPAKPAGFKAIVNKKGVVKLTWNWNKEPDLDGYLIYFSNSPKAEFSGIVNRAHYDTVFYDTLSLKMLNKDVYYQIVAVDKRFNRSAGSEIVKVMRPDTLPPVSPVIKSFFVTDSTIQIGWIPSSSVDVAKHLLYRKHLKTGTITEKEVKFSDTLYTDRNLIPEDKYQYYIQAIDQDENISPASNTTELSTYKNYYKDAVKIMHVEYDSTEKQVILDWNYNMKDVQKVVIFKGNSIDAVTRMPNSISASARSFVDSKVKSGPVFYAIKLYFIDGTESRISVPLGLVIP